MGNLHLVTGYAGAAHITAPDHGSFNAAIFGEGQVVLNRGNMLSATVVSNNQIRVNDGDIMMQGRHIRLNDGAYVDLAIDNGAQGYNRNDLIVARYTKNSSTGIEECNLVVIKGTATTGTATDPSYTTGDILGGSAFQNDMPLYRVPLNGLNVQPLVQLFSTADSNSEHAERTDNPHRVTAAQVGAASASHTHNASAINGGTLDSARLPVVPLSKGGTGATDGASGLSNLLAAGATVLSAHQYGTELPTAGTQGRIFFKKV